MPSHHLLCLFAHSLHVSPPHSRLCVASTDSLGSTTLYMMFPQTHSHSRHSPFSDSLESALHSVSVRAPLYFRSSGRSFRQSFVAVYHMLASATATFSHQFEFVVFLSVLLVSAPSVFLVSRLPAVGYVFSFVCYIHPTSWSNAENCRNITSVLCCICCDCRMASSF